MSWIVARIRWIMLVSGVLTSTMLYAVIAPQAALRSSFGETLEGPLAVFIGYLIGVRRGRATA